MDVGGVLIMSVKEINVAGNLVSLKRWECGRCGRCLQCKASRDESTAVGVGVGIWKPNTMSPDGEKKRAIPVHIYN